MTIEIRRVDGDERPRWDDLVERSPQGTPFHRQAFLEVIGDHSGATLHRLVGYKGQEPVGLFPVFERSVGPATVALSPPPNLKVTYLGPTLVNHRKLSTRKRERRHRRFVEGCLSWLDDELDPSLIQVRTGTRYDDPRPFEWNDFEVTPGYTYVVDLDRDEEDLLSAFSSDARENIRARDDDRVEIRPAGGAAAEATIEQVRERHETQDEPYGVTPEFVADLHDRLPEVVRPYEVLVDGEFAGGMVTLAHGDTVYRWQGGAKPSVDLPVNDCLDWEIMRGAIEDGRTRYDLVGAGNPRLCRYKAKFDPDLQTYRTISRGSRPANLAKKLYGRLR